MKNTALIARHCFRQVIRQKTFINVGLFGTAMVVAAIIVSQITYGDPVRVVRSIGLSGIVIATDLLALLLGVSLVHRDIEDKTLYVILARPVRHIEYVLGRHIGLLAAAILVLFGSAAFFWLALTMSRGSLSGSDLTAIVAAIPEISVMAALGLTISTITTPSVGAGLGLGVWVAASAVDDLRRLSEQQEGLLAQLIPLISEVLPQLYRFNFRPQAVYEVPVAASSIAGAFGYGLLYSLALLGFAAIVLSRRELR